MYSSVGSEQKHLSGELLVQIFCFILLKITFAFKIRDLTRLIMCMGLKSARHRLKRCSLYFCKEKASIQPYLSYYLDSSFVSKFMINHYFVTMANRAFCNFPKTRKLISLTYMLCIQNCFTTESGMWPGVKEIKQSCC